MNLVKWARRSTSPWPSITLDQLPGWFGQFQYQGLSYGPTLVQTIQQNRETISADFTGFINGAYKSNGAVFAVVLARMMLFSEARFQFRRMNNGRPGQLFGTQDLMPLEQPWPNGTTGDLLSRALLDVDLAGNWYCTRQPLQRQKGMKMVRLRPDWVTIILGSYDDPNPDQWDPNAELIGYVFQQPGSNREPKFFLPEEVCHFAPIPDPAAHYRGMSWIQPLLQEVIADSAMITHKEMYFAQGATPNLVVSMDTGKMNRETFEDWIDAFESQHEGAMNAYKTLYLGQGAEATIVGNNLKDLDYKIVQGHGEGRIAAAGGMPPMIVGFSEGLDASTLANFSEARRLLGDKTLRPLWRNFAGSMETLINPPPGAQLWYDDRDIAFLKEDQKDQADVQLTKATAMRLLVDAGYDPDSVVNAIESNDMTLLQHSGLYSVQLHPPGSKGDGSGGGSNGSGPGNNGSGNGNVDQNQNGGNGGNLASAGGRAEMLSNVTNVQQLAKALLEARAGSTHE